MFLEALAVAVLAALVLGIVLTVVALIMFPYEGKD